MSWQPQHRQYVEELARALARKHSHSTPVDLFKLAEVQGVLAIQLRSIVPEGITYPVTGGFMIAIRHGREETIQLHIDDPRRPRLTNRQRFTLAHEIAHTLYFHPFARDSKPTTRPRAPRGVRLERFCDRAARLLIVP